eukprot:m51a1_g1710 hypothetical protein (553) ;mRNA; f:528338-530243
MARCLLSVALAVLIASGVRSAIDPIRPPLSNIEFSNFKVAFNKVYATEQEETFRRGVFASTLQQIDRLRLEQPEATFTVNEFSDMTDDEFEAQYLSDIPESDNDTDLFFAPVVPEKDGIDGVVRPIRPLRPIIPPVDPIIVDAGDIVIRPTVVPRALPESYSSPYVTPVKSQRGCGSCWAFAAAAVVEHAWNKANGVNLSLSVQQILECTNGTCKGGKPSAALEYVLGVSRVGGGLMLSKDYPYTASDDGVCNAQGYRAAASIADYGRTTSDEAVDMPRALVAHGSLAVALNAKLLKSYHGGVVRGTAACDKKVNHAVTITGYTSDHWIVKNSWGSRWGEGGYFRIKRGTNACRIAKAGGVWATSTTCGIRSGFACAYGSEFGNDGNWGSWGSLAMCPTGTFATGVVTKSLGPQGSGDDVGLTGVQLLCGRAFFSGPTSLVAAQGTWDERYECPAGYYVTDISVMFQSPVGPGDDTAANRIRVRCRNDSGALFPLLGEPNSKTSWGTWTPWYSCPSGWVVAGLRTRVESDQGTRDDTALNAVRVRCVRISPL